MIASLPMYDWPELREATDRWWAGIAAALARAGIEAVPGRLVRGPGAFASWEAPGLLMSQTCGYPLVARYRGRLRVLGSPVYAAPGCAGPTYSSAIVVRAGAGLDAAEALRGRIAAVNGRESLSGFVALKAVFAPLAEAGRFFGGTVETGGHRASMEAVAEARADVAAIDCVTFAIARRHAPALADSLCVIAYSPPAPSLPYVTAAAASDDLVSRLRQGLAEAFADPALSPVREALMLEGLEPSDEALYLHEVAALEARGRGLSL